MSPFVKVLMLVGLWGGLMVGPALPVWAQTAPPTQDEPQETDDDAAEDDDGPRASGTATPTLSALQAQVTTLQTQLTA